MKRNIHLIKNNMKKLLFVLVSVLVTGCADVTQTLYKSKYQRQTLSKFGKSKNYSSGGFRYVPSRKRGDLRHPAVTRDTYKYKKGFE